MLLRVGWLFPDLMSTYGDRGNVVCLKRRAERRGIPVEIVPITPNSSPSVFQSIDLIVGGGSQNRELAIALELLHRGLGACLVERLEDGIPGLMICGAMQILGKSIQMGAQGTMEGLGFFKCKTVELDQRITGDLIFKITVDTLHFPLVLGFENHAGRTYLEGGEPLGEVVVGKGNNGADGLEGMFYKNVIGSYAHGPLLPKNPSLADWLLLTALKKKYSQSIAWDLLDDHYTSKARDHLLMLEKHSS